jgi:catechol 2,3-dioxygenase-like lactoylglutathione lyase family enzyme
MTETQAPKPTLRLGHVVLKMQNLEKAKGFYRDILGMKITEERADFGVLFLFKGLSSRHRRLQGQRRCNGGQRRRTSIPSSRPIPSTSTPDN